MKKLISLVYMLTFLGLISFHGQSDSAHTILAKCIGVHAGLNNVKIQIQSDMIVNDRIFQSQQHSVFMTEECVATEILGKTTIQHQDGRLLIADASHKTIIYSKEGNQPPPVVQVEMDGDKLKGLVKQEDKKRLILVPNTGPNYLIRVITPTQSEYLLIEYHISRTDHRIAKVVYNYQDPKASGVDKIEMTYTYSPISFSALPSRFKIDHYLDVKGKKVNLQSNYSSFRLIYTPNKD